MRPLPVCKIDLTFGADSLAKQTKNLLKMLMLFVPICLLRSLRKSSKIHTSFSPVVALNGQKRSVEPEQFPTQGTWFSEVHPRHWEKCVSCSVTYTLYLNSMKQVLKQIPIAKNNKNKVLTGAFWVLRLCVSVYFLHCTSPHFKKIPPWLCTWHSKWRLRTILNRYIVEGFLAARFQKKWRTKTKPWESE